LEKILTIFSKFEARKFFSTRRFDCYRFYARDLKSENDTKRGEDRIEKMEIQKKV